MDKGTKGAEIMNANNAWARMVELAKMAKVEKDADTKACMLDIVRDLFSVAKAAELNDWRDFDDTLTAAAMALEGAFSYRI